MAEKSPAALATRLNILYTLDKLLESVFGEHEVSGFFEEYLKTLSINEVKQSIYYGSDISARNRLKRTALHIAALNGHAKALQALLASKAEFCVLDKDGLSPLDLANDEKCIEVLKAVGADGWTPLMIAAEKHETATIREIIAGQTANIAAATRSGWTALHFAAATGSVEAVCILVDAGASVDARNIDGQTPLDLTTDEECCEALEGFGASRSPALLPGNSVRLSISYRCYNDAAEGPLHPGEVGTLIQDDGSDLPYLVRSADGTEGWYCRPAIVSASGPSDAVDGIPANVAR